MPDTCRNQVRGRRQEGRRSRSSAGLAMPSLRGLITRRPARVATASTRGPSVVPSEEIVAHSIIRRSLTLARSGSSPRGDLSPSRAATPRGQGPVGQPVLQFDMPELIGRACVPQNTSR